MNNLGIFEHVRPTSLIERFATPQETASLVAHVASHLASATTGAALRVDGGVVKSAFRAARPRRPRPGARR